MSSLRYWRSKIRQTSRSFVRERAECDFGFQDEPKPRFTMKQQKKRLESTRYQAMIESQCQSLAIEQPFSQRSHTSFLYILFSSFSTIRVANNVRGVVDPRQFDDNCHAIIADLSEIRSKWTGLLRTMSNFVNESDRWQVKWNRRNFGRTFYQCGGYMSRAIASSHFWISEGNFKYFHAVVMNRNWHPRYKQDKCTDIYLQHNTPW